MEQAKAYLAHAATLDPHDVQALTLLGRLYIQQGDSGAARTALEQAVAADPENWEAHNLLGNVYLKLNEFEKAREQAQLAIERGKGGGGAAQLVLGEALANLGRDQEAIQALKSFLQYAPTSPTAPQVRDLIAQLETRSSKPAGSSEVAGKVPAPLAGPDSMLAAVEPGPSINT
jgi:tetratricopeptide (TPR) repeat protein